MASPPDYFSCARCGFRGIGNPEAHECRSTVAERTGSTSAARAGRPARAPAPEPWAEPSFASDQALRSMCDAFSGLLGRHVRFTGWTTNGLARIEQRCAGCAATIAIELSSAGVEAMGQEAAARLGDGVRKRYLLHRCEPAAQSLFGFTYAELEELHAALERESLKLAERAAEIDKLRRGRS